MKIIYVNCGVKSYMKVDHCSYRRNFVVAKRKPEKKILSFCNFKSCVFDCNDLLSYNSSPHSSHIWFSYIHNYIIILSRVYNEQIQKPVPSWLVSSILVVHCTGIAEVKGLSPVQVWIFFCLLFTNAKVVSITTMIYFYLHFRWSNNNNNNNNNNSNNTYIVPISILLFSSALMKRLWSILHPTVHTYDFHVFMTLWSSFHGFIMNQFNNLLAVGLLAQLTERCTGITKAKGSSLVQAWIFFRLSFRNCKSCVYNCNDLLSYNTINYVN